MVDYFAQLRKMVEAGVSQDELRQILSQLRSFTQSAAPPPAPQAVPTTHNYSGPSFPPSYPPQPPLYQNSGAHQSFGAQPQYLQQPKTEQLDLASLLASASTAPPAPVVASQVAPISNITNLYNALLKAGVVSASGTPTGAGETAKAESKSDPVDAAKLSSREYRKLILSQKIKLTSAGITRYDLITKYLSCTNVLLLTGRGQR